MFKKMIDWITDAYRRTQDPYYKDGFELRSAEELFMIKEREELRFAQMSFEDSRIACKRRFTDYDRAVEQLQRMGLVTVGEG